MTIYLGHELAWRQWRAAVASTRMHHAWILAGMQGLGKGAFARAAARELIEEKGVHQPEWDNHPDILMLDHLPANDDEEKKRADGKPYQTKRNITVDQIRRMQQRITTRPTMGARRVIIIDPADDMEKGAVNALLKSLEEPPTGTFFLLVTHRPGCLLATVRSRCLVMNFLPLEDDAVDKLLHIEAPEADFDTRAAAVSAARGSPGAAIDFIGHGLGLVQKLMRQLLIKGDNDLTLRGALADEMSKKSDRLRQQAALDLARGILAAELHNATREQQQRIVTAHSALTQLSRQAPTYNFDAALLALEIGGLLASAALLREHA